MSKNNVEEISKRTFNQSGKYALRKLSVGVVSVLIGTTMYVGLAHADTVSSNNESAPVAQAITPTMGQQNSSNFEGGVVGNVVTSAGKQFQQAAPASSSDEIVNNVSQDSSDQNNNKTSTYINNDQQNSFDLRKTVSQNSAVSLEQSNIQENNNIAKNVKGQWIWDNGQTPSTTSVSEQTIGVNYEYRMGARFSFDVDGSQLKQGNIIDVAHISQTSSNSGMAAFNSENVDVPVLIDSRKIGYLSLSADTLPGDPNVVSFRFSRLNYRLRVTEPNLNYQGIQHFSVAAPWLGTLNYYSTWSFRGVKDSLVDFHFYGDGLDEHYKVHYSWPDNLDFGLQHQMGYSVAVSGGSFLSDSGWTSPTILFQNPLLKFANSSQLGLFNQSAGKQGSIDITNKSIDYGMRFYWDHGNSVLLSNVLPNLGVQFSFPVVNSDGSIVSSSQYPAYNWMDTRYMTLNHNFPAQVVASNLTLLQLKKLNAIGAVISRQSDGSALVYYHFPLTDMQMDFSKVNDYVLQRMISMSPYINYSTNSYADAIAMAKKMFATWSSSSMQSIPTSFSFFINWIYVSDPSTHPSMHVELLDPDTGTVLQNSVELGNYSKVISHGQSIVKLHVITPSGVALQQVKSFTDWPNQDKHAALSIPSITGYELVSNPQSVLSTLHLSGTAISSAQQVDYPVENTVADYYVVLQPKTESATVQIVDADESNKVLATGTVSGRFGEQIVSSVDMQAKLDALLKTGHYVLASNGFDSGADYKDGTNMVTISLKHKLDSIQRHYRVIEDLPDGTLKVIIDIEATLYKDADVDYYQQRGAYLNGTDRDHLLKSNDIHVIKGAGYTAPTDDNVVAPVDYLLGYHFQLIDGTNGYVNGVASWVEGSNIKYLAHCDIFNGVGRLDLTSGREAINVMPSRDFHIIYTKNQYPVTINYYDTSGKLVNSLTSTHKFGNMVSISPVAPANYVLTSGQAKVDHLVQPGLNEVDFLVEPKLTTTVEAKTVTRTIKVQISDSQTKNIVQTVKFVRNVYLNQVTKETTYSPWSFNGQYRFSSYQPKPMDGYAVDTAPEVIVTPDSSNAEVTVTYHKIPSVYSICYQLANGTVVKNVSVTPGNNGRIQLIAPIGYRLLTAVTNVRVDHSGQKLTVFVAPDEQTYTAKDTLPSGVTEPLSKTVTRTVKITMLNGHIRTVKQAVKFERTATIDGTGHVTYGNWQAIGRSQFNKVFVPKRAGYHLTGQADKLVVTADMTDSIVEIKYVKN